MARSTRIWFPGAIYHIMARGIRRMEIFSDDADRQVFMTILLTVQAKKPFLLHAYCLMTNHIHLLIESTDIPIGMIMKDILQFYAVYYNRKNRYKGHVFEDRYKSCLVKTDDYFLQTSRYIHLNPVKARIVQNPEQFVFSSYRTYLGLTDDKITWVKTTLSYFKDNPVMRYQSFVEDMSHKYQVYEDKIKKTIGEDEEWLPW